MDRLTLLLFLFTGIFPASAQDTTVQSMYFPIVSVIDGDTIETRNNKLPTPMDKISIRVDGIDTPESTYRAKCDKERQLGIEAKKALITVLKPYKRMVVSNCRYDKYGGRWLCNVKVGNIDIAYYMVYYGYARRYDGRIKSDWCQ